MDRKDLNIMRRLLINGRASHQSISKELGLSSNTVKTRIGRMMKEGAIEDFHTTVKVEAFGYDIIYVVVRHASERESDILRKAELIGDIFMVINCVGGITGLGIAVKGELEKKAELLKTLFEPAVVTNIFPVRAAPLERFTKTDILLMRHLIHHPRAPVKDIARAIRASARTVKRRLDTLMRKEVLQFTIRFDPAAMKGYINFSMLLDIDARKYKQVVRQIYDELSENFLLPPPPIAQESAFVVVLYTDNLRSMDEMFEKVRKLDGVRNAELLMPSAIRFRQEWLLRVLDSLLRRNRETRIIHQEEYALQT